jgi:hypothetical protein
LIAFTRDELLPEMTKRMQKQTGYLSYFYGNFSRDRSEWQTVPPTPRYGTHYVGLRNRIGILSESYVYATYKDRILATRSFVKNICEYAAENREKIRTMIKEAESKPSEKVALQFDSAPHGRPYTLLGFVEETKDGRRRPTKTPKGYEVMYTGGTKTTHSVDRPFAYLLSATSTKAIENLERHGIIIEELQEEAKLDVEVYRVDEINRGREFQKHQPVSVKVTSRKEDRTAKAGTKVVRTSQPLSDLAVFLLEPESSDGLVTWNFFDKELTKGGEFPVVRVPGKVALMTRAKKR